MAVLVGLGDGEETRMPLLPLMMGGRRPGVNGSVPTVGGNTRDVLGRLGYSEQQIESLDSSRPARVKN